MSDAGDDQAPGRQSLALQPSGGDDRGTRRDLPTVISEFQPDAVELEERPPPRVARLTLYGVTALITCCVLWASFSFVDEIVVAPGKLITSKPTIVVQPLETSIVRSIDVATGDIVRAGQSLATLDATFTQSDVEQQRAKLSTLEAQVRRSEAELNGSIYSLQPEASPDQHLQVRLFAQRRAYFQAQVENYDEQIAGQTATIESVGKQAQFLSSRRDTLGQIEAARQILYEHETGSLLNLLTSRDARLDVETNLAQMQGSAVEAEHTIAKLRADRNAFIEDFNRATMEQLVEFRSRRDEAAEQLKKMELRRTMVTLTAPADAVVLDMAQRSVGSVVREAEPLVTLVPLDVPLEADVAVNARDAGHLLVDAPVRIKFDAYPFQKFGTTDGRVRTISQDAFPADPKDQGSTAPPVFKARVALGKTILRAPATPVHLLPGMTVTAEIKVGRRRVISYFLYPLIRGLDDSIREP